MGIHRVECRRQTLYMFTAMINQRGDSGLLRLNKICAHNSPVLLVLAYWAINTHAKHSSAHITRLFRKINLQISRQLFIAAYTGVNVPSWLPLSALLYRLCVPGDHHGLTNSSEITWRQHYSAFNAHRKHSFGWFLRLVFWSSAVFYVLMFKLDVDVCKQDVLLIWPQPAGNLHHL